jgi:ankyrin repeat protein
MKGIENTGGIEKQGLNHSLKSLTLARLINEPDDKGVTALIRACLKGYREIVKLLIEKGGGATDLNSVEVTQGSTVLHWAVFEG